MDSKVRPVTHSWYDLGQSPLWFRFLICKEQQYLPLITAMIRVSSSVKGSAQCPLVSAEHSANAGLLITITATLNLSFILKSLIYQEFIFEWDINFHICKKYKYRLYVPFTGLSVSMPVTHRINYCGFIIFIAVEKALLTSCFSSGMFRFWVLSFFFFHIRLWTTSSSSKKKLS